MTGRAVHHALAKVACEDSMMVVAAIVICAQAQEVGDAVVAVCTSSLELGTLFVLMALLPTSTLLNQMARSSRYLDIREQACPDRSVLS
jgi:hypothetical protein